MIGAEVVRPSYALDFHAMHHGLLLLADLLELRRELHRQFAGTFAGDTLEFLKDVQFEELAEEDQRVLLLLKIPLLRNMVHWKGTLNSTLLLPDATGRALFGAEDAGGANLAWLSRDCFDLGVTIQTLEGLLFSNFREPADFVELSASELAHFEVFGSANHSRIYLDSYERS